MQCELTIEALGAGGDGIARRDGAKLFVPGALPGERVRAELGRAASGGAVARVLERLSNSPARVAPPCQYFGLCGGCVAQHIAARPYAEWKAGVIREALAHRGLTDIAMAPLIASPRASRRRARLAAALPAGGRVPKGEVALGFRRRRGHEVTAIESCAVLLPVLNGLLRPLSGLVAEIGGGVTEVSLTRAHEGIDVILHGLAAPPSLATRETLAGFAQSHGIQRLSVESPAPGRGGGGGKRRRERRPAPMLETIVQPGAVQARFAGIPVDAPPSAFLQPTAAGEAAIQRLVRDGLAVAELAPRKGGVRIADLYAGLGGIGFALAGGGGRVAMFEGSAEMAGAAEAAARRAGVSVTAEARDLARRPLGVDELKPYDAVIFDPPRAGARAQAEALAASRVARIAAVSCHPPSFARDARILTDGGYRLSALTPIDQFLWSSHVELVAIFRRGG